MDERRIKFDIEALKEIVRFSGFTAMSGGLPRIDLSDIILDPPAAAAKFIFVGTEVTLGLEKLGAFLVAYCIRSGIKIPRRGDRRALIEPTTITLVFIQEYGIAPIPQSVIPDQGRLQVVGRNASVEWLRSSQR